MQVYLFVFYFSFSNSLSWSLYVGLKTKRKKKTFFKLQKKWSQIIKINYDFLFFHFFVVFSKLATTSFKCDRFALTSAVRDEKKRKRKLVEIFEISSKTIGRAFWMALLTSFFFYFHWRWWHVKTCRILPICKMKYGFFRVLFGFFFFLNYLFKFFCCCC